MEKIGILLFVCFCLVHSDYVTLNADNTTKVVEENINDINDYLLKSKSNENIKNWDPAFDCKIKKLAYEFAQKLSPGTGKPDELKYIFDALELNTTCTMPTNYGKFEYSWYKRRVPESVDSTDNIKVFVDNTNGKLTNKGDITAPLSDIQLGIVKCKDLKKQSSICTVYIREGIYRISKPIKIDSDNIKLRNYGQEKVIVTSNVVIKDPKWKPYRVKTDTFEGFNPIFEKIQPKESTRSVIYLGKVDNSTQCQNLCVNYSKLSNCTSYVYFNESEKGFENQCYIRNDGKWNPLNSNNAISGKRINIYSADLSSENLDKVRQIFIGGRRAVRARFPNANPEIQGLHTIPTGYVNNAVWTPPRKSADALEVHIDQPQRKATLFPNYQIGMDGSVSQFDPPQSYWGTKDPFGGGGATYKVPSGLQYSKDLEINLRKWGNPSTGILHGFQNLHWGNWMFRLDGRNQVNQTLHWTWGGFQEARGSTKGKEWYVENIFEEIDVPGEWFYDKNTKILYYYPNGSLPEEVSIPQLENVIEIMGSKDKTVINASVSGLTITGSIKTFLSKYMVPSGGDWTVHRSGMIFAEGTENLHIEGCTLDSPGSNGIFLYKYNRDAIISHNTMYRLGDNGIVLVGEAKMMDGTNGEQPRRTQLYYNLIFENGLWGKQTYPFVQSVACETHLEGNVFFNGPRAGMNFNDGFGGGNVLLNNLLFNFVRETDDHGPINTWDRVPYITRVADGKTLSFEVKENQIHRNFIINNYRSVWPIDHDDGTCFWNDTYNYLVYGGFKNYLGHNKISRHNIYVYPDRHPYHEAFGEQFCADSAGQTSGTSGYGDIYENNRCVFGATKYIYNLGSCQAQYVGELIPHFENNELFTPNMSYSIKCGKDVWDFEQAQKYGIDLGTVLKELPNDEDVIQWGRDILGL